MQFGNANVNAIKYYIPFKKLRHKSLVGDFVIFTPDFYFKSQNDNQPNVNLTIFIDMIMYYNIIMNNVFP